MNEVLIKTMAIAAFTVTIMGGMLLSVLRMLLSVLLGYGIFRLLADVWERTSAVAKNTKEYLENRSDFELYKRDADFWDELKRNNVEKCSRCEYRRKAMEDERHDT